MIANPKMYLEKSGQTEVDVSKVVEGLRFLGDTTTPAYTNAYQDNTGLDGQVLSAVTYGKTTTNANFRLFFGDYYDLVNAKRDIYRLFSSRSLMRMRTDAEPGIVKYVLATPFDIAPTETSSHLALFTIPFDNPSGVKYSAVRSDELASNPDMVQLGMGLSVAYPDYAFTTKQFVVYNPSDIPIMPYQQRHDLRLIINFAGESITITNNTNGTSWSYNKAATMADTIILDGVSTTLNGTAASANTDYGNIDLEMGANSISVTGATEIDIKFSFPFIYLS